MSKKNISSHSGRNSSFLQIAKFVLLIRFSKVFGQNLVLIPHFSNSKSTSDLSLGELLTIYKMVSGP